MSPPLPSNEQASLAGQLVSLKTTLELRPGDALIEVYITKVPLKSANSVLSSTRALYGNYNALDLQHLRKFAKAKELPISVLSTLGQPAGKENEPANSGAATSLFLLAGPTKGILVEDLFKLLSNLGPDGLPSMPLIATIQVPLLAPTSAEQASEWSKIYWPIVYKKSNPFGPHPAIVDRAASEIANTTPTWLALAARVGGSSKRHGIGDAIGAIIVDRNGETPQIVALAADARWKDHQHCPQEGDGNIMSHAALRAIGMIAQKLKAKGEKYASRRNPVLDTHEQGVFGDVPLLPEEKLVFEQDNINPDGYLCHGLEIYMTHEPCIMCSMAILHSRFSKVVFGQRMCETGGICSEGNNETDGVDGLGYGLFWRKELNWSLLAWEFKEDKIDQSTILDGMMHV